MIFSAVKGLQSETEDQKLASEPCAERIRLADGVIKAVEEVYRLRAEVDKAKKAKRDLGPLKIALTLARTRERNAVRALDLHKREHECG